MSKRKPIEYIKDIREEIESIENFVEGYDFDSFVSDQKTAHAVVRALEIIGEVASQIPGKFRENSPGLPWRQMVEMRNKVIHEYSDVDLEIVWQTVQEDIPELKKKLNEVEF